MVYRHGHHALDLPLITAASARIRPGPARSRGSGRPVTCSARLERLEQRVRAGRR